jgi:carboxyl-terminal processing protease
VFIECGDKYLKNMSSKKYLIIVLGGLILISVLGIGLFWGGYKYGLSKLPSSEAVTSVTNKSADQPQGVDFSLFWDTWKAVQEKYVGRADLNAQKMVYGAISGMVNSLGDPYSVFLEPQKAKRFMEDVQGSFDGIGAEIGLRNGFITVVKPLQGSPALRAGLKSGDKVLKIDDKDTTNLSLDEAVSMIRGPKGTTVALMVLSLADTKPKEVKIIRDTISVPILTYEITKDNFLKVSLTEFSEDAGTKFNQMVRQLSGKEIKGMIFDLRGNPGGYLEVAQDIASYFIPEGQTVVIEDFGNGKKSKTYYSFGYKTFENIPMVVLIDEGSASASEILAGALRDDRGISLVGQKSFGKGSVQELSDLPGGSKLKVTIAKWLTPKGYSIADNGLEPDIKIDLTEEDVSAGKDPQMDKAVEVLNQAVGVRK